LRRILGLAKVALGFWRSSPLRCKNPHSARTLEILRAIVGGATALPISPSHARSRNLSSAARFAVPPWRARMYAANDSRSRK
jgi:hypothetical protein